MNKTDFSLENMISRPSVGMKTFLEILDSCCFKLSILFKIIWIEDIFFLSKQCSLNQLIILNVYVGFSKVSAYLSKYSCQDAFECHISSHMVYFSYLPVCYLSRAEAPLGCKPARNVDAVCGVLCSPHSVHSSGCIAEGPNFSEASTSCLLSIDMTLQLHLL